MNLDDEPQETLNKAFETVQSHLTDILKGLDEHGGHIIDITPLIEVWMLGYKEGQKEPHE